MAKGWAILDKVGLVNKANGGVDWSESQGVVVSYYSVKQPCRKPDETALC